MSVDPVSSAISLIFFLWLIGFLWWLQRRQQPLEVEVLNDEHQNWKRLLHGLILSRKDFKEVLKDLKKDQKKRQHQGVDKVCFVLEFEGDLRATQVDRLRREISAVLTSARPGQDEVLVCLNSSGGSVVDYGWGWAQLMRIRKAGIQLTVVVDKVAASGGYLMALAAHQLVANEFAFIGSVGVVAEVFNVHRLLQRFNVDFVELTAGESKRSITPFGPITYEKTQRLQSQLEEIHEQFLDQLRQLRPQADWQKAASARIWTARQALELGLVDVIGTSDQLIFERIQEGWLVLKVRWRQPKSFSQRVTEGVLMAIENRLLKWLSDRW